MACDLMDGRDAFLTLARDKHLEFSSLRRSKWSTMCMLVELHNQSQDRFVYTCNECKHHVETRFHCTVCEVRTIEWERWDKGTRSHIEDPYYFYKCYVMLICGFSQDRPKIKALFVVSSVIKKLCQEIPVLSITM